MKKIYTLLLSALCVCSVTKAQSIEDAKKHIYYERFETAKGILKSVINGGNASPDAWYWLAEIYLEQDHRDSARQVLENKTNELLKENGTQKQHPLIFIGWAHVLLDSGLVPQAKQQMTAILEVGKYKDATALMAVAKANMESKHGDSSWAVELLEKAVKRDKKNEAMYTALGDAYRKMIDGSNAIINYGKALEINPSYAEAMYKEGKIYKTQNNAEIYVDRFTKALQADSNYGPALYELYYHYYFRDVVRSKAFLAKYIQQSDPSPKHAYMMADMDYVSKNWQLAIKEANNILQAEGATAQPRLYKMIAYSNAALGDSASALTNMELYFQKQQDTGLVSRDFAMKAALLEKLSPDTAQAIEWYKKAIGREQDEKETLSYMVHIADLQQALGNREREAIWREKIYSVKEQPTNLDIYKWGMALYSEKDYEGADSVFAIYEEKYPGHIHGHLWRARSNALIDTNMEKGLAVPHYLKLLDIISTDTIKNKTLLVRTYEYLGAYEANTTKDYPASLEYYDKVLQLEPANDDALKYTAILKKWINDGKGTN